MAKRHTTDTRYVLIVPLRSVSSQAATRSLFASHIKNNYDSSYDAVAKEFDVEEDAILFADRFLNACGTFATYKENQLKVWHIPAYWLSKVWHMLVPVIIPIIIAMQYKIGSRRTLELKEVDYGEVKYYLYCTINGESQTTYAFSSRDEAVRDVEETLDTYDLEPTSEENENGFWSGTNADGDEIILELKLVLDGNEYSNINPSETLSNYSLQRLRTTETPTVKSGNGQIAGWLTLAILGVVAFMLKLYIDTLPKNPYLQYLEPNPTAELAVAFFTYFVLPPICWLSGGYLAVIALVGFVQSLKKN